jgi:uncharacterized membrane protein YiaA
MNHWTCEFNNNLIYRNNKSVFVPIIVLMALSRLPYQRTTEQFADREKKSICSHFCLIRQLQMTPFICNDYI